MDKKVVEVLRQGGVVVFETDTVWGVGCRVGDVRALERLYKIKQRDKSKPTAILVSDVGMAEKYGVMGKRALELAKKYWPGGLTLVVEARGGGTVGLRVPDHKELLEVIEELGEGVVASSANFAGEPAPRTRSEIDEKLVAKVDLVMPSYAKASDGEASTVAWVIGDKVEILRQGKITIDL